MKHWAQFRFRPNHYPGLCFAQPGKVWRAEAWNEVHWLSSSSFVLNYLNLVLGRNYLPSTRSPNFSVFRFVYLSILMVYYLTEKDGIVDLWDYKRSSNVLWAVTNPVLKYHESRKTSTRLFQNKIHLFINILWKKI